MTPEILHDASRQRFLTIVDGHEGYVQYELAGDVMAIVHTIVPAAIGGRGIASDLVQHAFDYARAEGLRVAPLCSYAEVWLRRHPDYADLAT
ncbi:MAG: N-acetyltransferase [Xanthomonadaceae bacterium]|nr:N-acetyltransferase [Xanthomonadaceae bacterium]